MELTFKNVYDLLESTEYTKETFDLPLIRLQAYKSLVNLLLDNFFPDYEIEEFECENPSVGFKITGPKIASLYENVTLVEIDRFYPTTMSLLSKAQKINLNQEIDPFNEEDWDNNNEIIFNRPLIWNIKEFPIILDFLLTNYNQFKENDERIFSLVKCLVNYTYGSIMSRYAYLKCSEPSLIMDTINKISEHIQREFSDYFIYADSDTFYFSDFDEMLPSLKGKLDDWGYTYKISKINYFLYIDKKRLAISDTPFKTLGIKSIKSVKQIKEKMRHLHNQINY